MNYNYNMTDINKIYDTVKAEYDKYDVELNGCHFDFNVEHIRGIEILIAYAELQGDINGDAIVRIEDPVYSEDNEHIIGGKIVDLDDGSLDDYYTGNVEEFLRSLDGTGVFRFIELETDDTTDNVVCGDLLSFVF